MGQLEFTVDAIRVSRDESETAMQLDELFFVRLFISLESLI